MTDTEINNLVARKMGWTDSQYPVDNKEWCQRKGDYSRWDAMDFCHSIEAAWEVVMSVPQIQLGRVPKSSDPFDFEWHCCFYDYGSKCSATSDTAPMAICLAFLKLS